MSERRKVLEEAIQRHGLTIAGRGTFGGSSIWMRAPEGVDTGQVALHLRGNGVLIEPGAPFFAASAPPTQFYRLAYSSIPSARISDGVRLVAEAMR